MTLSLSSAATTLGRLARDERGNIAVIFAIALLPVLSFVGAAAKSTPPSPRSAHPFPSCAFRSSPTYPFCLILARGSKG